MIPPKGFFMPLYKTARGRKRLAGINTRDRSATFPLPDHSGRRPFRPVTSSKDPGMAGRFVPGSARLCGVPVSDWQTPRVVQCVGGQNCCRGVCWKEKCNRHLAVKKYYCEYFNWGTLKWWDNISVGCYLVLVLLR